MLSRLATALALCLAASAASAQETTIKLTLGWKTQGSDAAFFVAKDKGYFKQEGLNVVIDQGEGSGATVTRIMGGAYDAGFGDMNAIIQNASTRPADAPVMVYMLWNQPPFAIVSKTAAGIKTPKDFEGRTLGGAQGTPTTRMLPVFAKANNLDLGQNQGQQHGPEPPGADADPGPDRRRARLQHHELLQPRAEPTGPGQGLLLDLVRRLRTRPLLERPHGLAEAHQGQS
jgi:ABC-type nitrate/sulfonate/bicarbonate transport system substrate-binding protein